MAFRSYPITIMKELMVQYVDWNTLQAFLESEQGGWLRITDQTATYALIRYDKGSSRMELPHVRWFRSVVWDKIKNRPVSVAPPKTTNEPFPYSTGEEAEMNGIGWEEYRDGFMIQTFCTNEETGGAEEKKIHTTSRSSLNASGMFYSHRTFYELFQEAGGVEKEAEWMSSLEEPGVESVFASYLVQHPEHRRVSPFESAQRFHIHTGKVYSDGRLEWAEKVSPWESRPTGDISVWLQEQYKDRPWHFQGLVAKNGKGERWRWRSEKYMAVKSLRGNEPHVVERFSRLFTHHLSHTYLEYYPEDLIPFSLYTVFMNHLIQYLYDTYVSYYVRKETPYSEIPSVYRTHLYALHGRYLSHLRPQQRWMTPQDIRLYLMSQAPARISFLLRNHQNEYHTRV